MSNGSPGEYASSKKRRCRPNRKQSGHRALEGQHATRRQKVRLAVPRAPVVLGVRQQVAGASPRVHEAVDPPKDGVKLSLTGGDTPSRGFTLLEILVAFTVMAVLLTVLLQVFSSGLRGAELGDQYTRAVLLAQSKMASLEAEEHGLKLGERAGRFDDTYAWRSEVTAYRTDAYLQPEELAVHVYPVMAMVEVTWQTGGRQRSVYLKTLRLVPLP